MAGADRRNQAAERVWRDMPDGAPEQLEGALAPTDLRSLLIDVAWRPRRSGAVG
jgi:hypothetical protein